MEKKQQQQQQQQRPPIWDCGSTLYDSFELDSFQRRLDVALSARSLSMPHLPHHSPLPPNPAANGSSRISRSFKKLMRYFLFRAKSKKPDHHHHINDSGYKGKGKGKRWFVVMEDDDVVYEKSGALSGIPEAPEAELVWPEIGGVVGKTVSERFAARSVSMNVISSRGLV